MGYKDTNVSPFRFYTRWKEWESWYSQSFGLHFSLREEQWQEDWAFILSLASQVICLGFLSLPPSGPLLTTKTSPLLSGSMQRSLLSARHTDHQSLRCHFTCLALWLWDNRWPWLQSHCKSVWLRVFFLLRAQIDVIYSATSSSLSLNWWSHQHGLDF